MSTDKEIEAEIQAKGLTAPRVTLASIEAKIVSEHYFTAEDGVFGAKSAEVYHYNDKALIEEVEISATSRPLGLLTICVLVLENGFTVTGIAGVASPENFDAEIGRKVSRQKAIDQIWPLEGYLLKENLYLDSLITSTQLVVDPLEGQGVPAEIRAVEKIEQIAKACHEANRAYCKAIGDDSQPTWEDAPDWQRASAIKGVEFIQANPDASPAASHESWLEQKRADGWKFGPVKDPEAKEHPCFVPYDELPLEQRAKDYIFGAIVRSFL